MLGNLQFIDQEDNRNYDQSIKRPHQTFPKQMIFSHFLIVVHELWDFSSVTGMEPVLKSSLSSESMHPGPPGIPLLVLKKVSREKVYVCYTGPQAHE